MNSKTRLFLALAGVSFWTMLVLISCRKADLTSTVIRGNESISVESRFFGSYRSEDPAENAIVNYLMRQNDRKHFVEATVSKIGYPRWDKAIRSKSRSKSSSVKVLGKTKMNDADVSGTYDVYYVPFVRDSQNYVNASLVIKASATDTSMSYLCDWQYRGLQNDDDKLNDAAEHFAVFFMVLDRAVFGHTRFQITDKSIFKNNNHPAREVVLNPPPADAVKINLMAEYCQDVTISWTDCPYIPVLGHCGGQPVCDNCPSCTSSISYTYCWQQWIDEGGGGGGGTGGTGGGGSGGTGGTGGGSDVPPDPCVQQTTGSVREPKTQINPGIKGNVLCNVDPGWTPTWTFTGDDGITFTDPDPAKEVDLQFDPNDHIEAKYPNFYQLVKSLKAFVMSSPEVLSALVHWSGYNKQQILDKLTFGKGPLIKVVEGLDSYSKYNRTTGENVLLMGATWVRGLEAAVLPATKQGTAFLIAVSLLHEFVHYGTAHNNIDEGKFDFGWGFERSAFNVIVNDLNANETSIKFKKLP